MLFFYLAKGQGRPLTPLASGLPSLALLAAQHASPCFVPHKTSHNSALIISTLFTGLLIWTAQLKAESAVAEQDNIEVALWESELSHSGMSTSGHPSRAGGLERWLRPVVRSHSGLSHGREGIGWVAGCEMPDDGGEAGPGLVRGPLWPNVGQTGVSGRPPRPHQAGGGAFFIIEETRQYESGDNGGAVLKPLTPHMPPRICRRTSSATFSCASSYSASSYHNLVSRAYYTSLHCNAFCLILPFCHSFWSGVMRFPKNSTLKSVNKTRRTTYTYIVHGLILHSMSRDLRRMQQEEIASTALIDRLGSNDDVASHCKFIIRLLLDTAENSILLKTIKYP